MADPQELLKMLAGEAKLDEIAAFVDALEEAERLAVLSLLGGSVMATLWTRAENTASQASLSQLVPSDAEPNTAVAWEGRNSLPAFSAFAKVFTRVGAAEGTLLGYNRNPGFILWSVGPGYFTCVEPQHRPSELLVDYTKEPTAGVPGWPAVRKNGVGIGRFVYYNGHDYLRAVGRHMFIGADYDAVTGKPRGHYFTLVRGATIAVTVPEPVPAAPEAPPPP